MRLLVELLIASLEASSDAIFQTMLSSFRFLPGSMTWRDLFDIVIVQAQKPAFWGDGTLMTEIVSDDGLMRACSSFRRGGVFYGGSARMVQSALGMSGDHFLYVGDHIYTDAALAKLNFKCVMNDDACLRTQSVPVVRALGMMYQTSATVSSHMCVVRVICIVARNGD
jgi:hypothetical protein